MKKNVFAVLLIALLIPITLIAGCNGKGENVQGGTTGTDPIPSVSTTLPTPVPPDVPTIETVSPFSFLSDVNRNAYTGYDGYEGMIVPPGTPPSVSSVPQPWKLETGIPIGINLGAESAPIPYYYVCGETEYLVLLITEERDTRYPLLVVAQVQFGSVECFRNAIRHSQPFFITPVVFKNVSWMEGNVYLFNTASHGSNNLLMEEGSAGTDTVYGIVGNAEGNTMYPVLTGEEILAFRRVFERFSIAELVPEGTVLPQTLRFPYLDLNEYETYRAAQAMNAWNARFAERVWMNWYRGEDGVRCYGVYNGAVVFFVQSEEATRDESRIGGIALDYDAPYALWVWHDGGFMRAEAAVDAGRLTAQDLDEIRLIHRTCSSRMYAVRDARLPKLTYLLLDTAVDQSIRESFAALEESLDASLIRIRCVAAFDKVFACYVDAPADCMEKRYETVSGHLFTYASGQPLYVWKDGVFYTVFEAFDAGLMTEDEVAQLHKVYDPVRYDLTSEISAAPDIDLSLLQEYVRTNQESEALAALLERTTEVKAYEVVGTYLERTEYAVCFLFSGEEVIGAVLFTFDQVGMAFEEVYDPAADTDQICSALSVEQYYRSYLRSIRYEPAFEVLALQRQSTGYPGVHSIGRLSGEETLRYMAGTPKAFSCVDPFTTLEEGRAAFEGYLAHRSALEQIEMFAWRDEDAARSFQWGYLNVFMHRDATRQGLTSEECAFLWDSDNYFAIPLMDERRVEDRYILYLLFYHTDLIGEIILEKTDDGIVMVWQNVTQKDATGAYLPIEESQYVTCYWQGANSDPQAEVMGMYFYEGKLHAVVVLP